MKIHCILIVLFLFASPILLNGQNIIWLNNGKQLSIGEYKIENKDTIFYSTLKGKYKIIETFDVFSIIEKSGTEKILYIPDTTYQDAFTIPQMKSFVQGQYDAIQRFKSPWVTIGGIGISGVSSLFVNPVYVFAISGAYCSGIGITGTSKKKLAFSAELKDNKHYMLGYKKASKHKRIKNAIIGSGIGLAVGLTSFALINKK